MGLADGKDSLDKPVGQAGGAGWYRTVRGSMLLGHADRTAAWTLDNGQADGQTSETGPTWQGIRLGSRRAVNTGGRAIH